MSNLVGLGLKNFRVFKELTQFEFAPITVLTGTNSSGKSSLFKALLLLQDNAENGFNQLDFLRSDVHKLGGFDNAKCKFSEEEEMVFELEYDFGLEPSDMDRNGASLVLLGYSKTIVQLIFEKKPNSPFLGQIKSFKVIEKNEEAPIDLIHLQFLHHDIAVYDYLKNSKGEHLRDKDGNSKLDPKGFEIKAISSINLVKLLANYKNKRNEVIQQYKSQSTAYRFSIDMLLSLVFPYSDKFSWEDIENYDGDILDVESVKKILNTDQLEEDFIQRSEDNILNHLSTVEFNINYGYHSGEVLERTWDLIEEYIHEHLALLTDSDTAEREGFVGEYFRKVKFNLGDDSTPHALEEIVNTQFFNLFLNGLLRVHIEEIFKHTKKSIYYFIEAVRANTQRLYANNSIKTFDDFLIQYKKHGISKPQLEFINKWLQVFEIGQELRIKDVGIGAASEVFLVNKQGDEMPIADLGYGITQMLPLLLRIVFEINLMKNQNQYYYVPFSGDKNLRKYEHYKLFLIEEPETNLHPALQAKLADFFIDVARTYRVRFIIETHSEYLIRKLQYLTAKQEISPEDTALYYFYPPEQPRPEGEPQVKRIRILNDGRLDGEFGTGFFDEATKLMMALLTGENLN